MRTTITYLDKDGLSGRYEITTKPPLSGRSSAAYHVYTNGWLSFFHNQYDRCRAFVDEEVKRMGYTIIGEKK